MSPRVISAIAVVAAVLGCETSIPVIGIPTHLAMVSGSDQTADVGATLADPLVVQALDGANHQLKNITIKWTVATGGGSLSADSSITDATGQASVQWTLGPEPGAQSVTATAAGFDGAAATFLASNGSVITGTVAIANSSPTSLFVLRSAGASGLDRSALDDGSMAARQPRFSDRGIVVLFRGDVLRVASAGSGAYRSQAVARSVAHTLAQHLASVTRGLPVRGARVSPAILAAHLDIADTSRVNDVLAALRADPAVSRADRDVIISIRDGAPRPQAARLPPAVFGTTAAGRAANTLLPNDPAYYAEAWGPGMVDLPRAWAITTGSASVTVAVVDMGVRFEDPELAGNLSSDGYDFVSQITLASLGYDSIGHYCGGGADFTTIDGDGDGPDANPSDPDDIYLDSLGTCWSHNDLGDHGQWTSGIIGAVSNNNYGVTGVNWSVRVRPVRVLGITGEGSAFDVAQGVLYAAGLPAVGANDTLVTAPSRAPIVNMSLGSPADDASLSSAVAAAVQQGCLVVASAGNQTWDLPTYPAAYPGVLGVSAVGMDGQIASYSNGGSYVGLAAPGGEFRLDDNGGDGVLGLGWDFVAGQPVFLFGYGTSAAAPYVSGVAALLLAKDAGLSAADLTSRLEQYASRPVNATRDDNYGWGIVDAYNALTQKPGPTRSRYVELFDAAGAVARSAQADSNGAFALADLEPGTYNLVAGEDEDGDGTIGVPGRRFGVAGGVASPLALQVLSSATLLRAAVTIGVPMESEPNDQIANANLLEVGTYVVGTITPPDVQDVYAVPIPASGQYTFETSGVVGSCGWGIELDTRLSLSDSNGTVLDVNDNAGAFTGPYCSKLTGTASPGTLYITVTGSSADGLADHGRYRLQVRSGP